MSKRLTVFISYTWDNEIHKQWVLKLANDLITKGGLEVILDQYDLKVGNETTYFMEESLEKADKILVILTENYKQKADQRKGGAGFEYSMISQSLYEIQDNNNKFVPILRSGDSFSSAPKYLKGRIYHSMKNDNTYEFDFSKLVRIIYESPELIKPQTGKIPNYENLGTDPIIAIAKDLSAKENINRELDQILASTEGLNLVTEEIKKLFNSIEQKANAYTEKTDFNFRIQKNTNLGLSVNSYGNSATLLWNQIYSNSLKGATFTMTLWSGSVNLHNMNQFSFHDELAAKISESDYSADLTENREVIWRKNKDITVKSADIISMIFAYLIKAIQNEKERTFRKF